MRKGVYHSVIIYLFSEESTLRQQAKEIKEWKELINAFPELETSVISGRRNRNRPITFIPISHRCTEFEGREWKEDFSLSINDKRLTGELQPIRNETVFISLIDRENTSFEFFTSV